MANKLQNGIALGIAGAGLIGLLGGSSPAQACWIGDDPVPSTRTSEPGDIDYYKVQVDFDNGEPMFVMSSRDNRMYAEVGFKRKHKTSLREGGYVRDTLWLTADSCPKCCGPKGLKYDIRDWDYTGVTKELGFDLTPCTEREFCGKAPVAMDFPGRCGEKVAYEVIEAYYQEKFPEYTKYNMGNGATLFVHPNMISCDSDLQECWDCGTERVVKQMWKESCCK